MPPQLALDALLAAFEEIDTITNEVTVRENLRTKINKFLPVPARGTTWDFTASEESVCLGADVSGNRVRPLTQPVQWQQDKSCSPCTLRHIAGEYQCRATCSTRVLALPHD